MGLIRECEPGEFDWSFLIAWDCVESKRSNKTENTYKIVLLMTKDDVINAKIHVKQKINMYKKHK